MITIEEFLETFASQFDETDASEIRPETVYHDLDEWSSMIVVGLIGMVNVDYDVVLTGDEIKNAVTVNDLFEIVKSKME